MQHSKLLLFDLDGTLLRSDKTISQRTLQVLNQCKQKGILIGVSTSRGEQNALSFYRRIKTRHTDCKRRSIDSVQEPISLQSRIYHR